MTNLSRIRIGKYSDPLPLPVQIRKNMRSRFQLWIQIKSVGIHNTAFNDQKLSLKITSETESQRSFHYKEISHFYPFSRHFFGSPGSGSETLNTRFRSSTRIPPDRTGQGIKSVNQSKQCNCLLKMY